VKYITEEMGKYRMTPACDDDCRGPIVVSIMSVWQHVPLLLGQILIAS
jgi:hypothetical protein